MTTTELFKRNTTTPIGKSKDHHKCINRPQLSIKKPMFHVWIHHYINKQPERYHFQTIPHCHNADIKPNITFQSWIYHTSRTRFPRNDSCPSWISRRSVSTRSTVHSQSFKPPAGRHKRDLQIRNIFLYCIQDRNHINCSLATTLKQFTVCPHCIFW
jgi:hypothetical protein